MRFSYVKLRVPFNGVPNGSGIFNDRDVFAQPDYELSDAGHLIRIRHKSGACVVVPTVALYSAVPVEQETATMQQHVGKRR